MPALVITETRIHAGIWEGVVQGATATATATAPEIEVLHDETRVAGATLTSLPGRPGLWALRVPIPTERLADGVQTFVIRTPDSAEILAQFRILVGDGAGGDLRAELDLLRAEFDLLKAAFRRHCRETG